MQQLHTPGPWESCESTEDYQGHFIMCNGRTVAATITEDACKVTKEDAANCKLIVASPSMLKALRQIARDADFQQQDGAMELGERLIGIERQAQAAIALYEAGIGGRISKHKENVNE